MIHSTNPPLPVPVALGEAASIPKSGANVDIPLPVETTPLSRSLQHGCYLLQWRPLDAESQSFIGVMRVERRNEDITASGDVYLHRASHTSDPDPSEGIPTFPCSNYSYYLRVTKILKSGSSPDTLTLGFSRYSYNRTFNIWNFGGDFTAAMQFKATPASYPPNANYLEGDIADSSDAVVGVLALGWVSKYLRKAILEVDRLPGSEYPADNGADVHWKKVYDSTDWDVNVYESDTDLVEPSGESWSDGEMHAAMLKRRDSADLDKEWRFHLLCVRRLDSTSRGIMYDGDAGDTDKIPRQGAGISSHWMIPNKDPPWGTVAGKRFGAAPGPYFRTAVHEIGHAMGLYHNTADNGFMNTTITIAESPGAFPANIQWNFNAADARRLRHMPDPWVRPGMIPFGLPYRTTPMSLADRLDLSGPLVLEVKPLLSTVPIGAPVRVRITLRNTTKAALVVPASLSLKSGYVCGRVVGPGGSSKGFQSIMRCIDEPEHQKLDPDNELSHDLTLLRGQDGALFEAPGLHQIKVDVTWEENSTPVYVRGSTAVMVQPAKTKSHAEAALKTLSTPDLLLTLALGGDHLTDGIEALKVALADKTLAPHYRIIEAKRLGHRFQERSANASGALKMLKKDTVMSPSEVKHVAALVKGVARPKSGPVKAMKKSAAGDRSAEEIVDNL